MVRSEDLKLPVVGPCMRGWCLHGRVLYLILYTIYIRSLH
jgi:hypothetical protein